MFLKLHTKFQTNIPTRTMINTLALSYRYKYYVSIIKSWLHISIYVIMCQRKCITKKSYTSKKQLYIPSVEQENNYTFIIYCMLWYIFYRKWEQSRVGKVRHNFFNVFLQKKLLTHLQHLKNWKLVLITKIFL